MYDPEDRNLIMFLKEFKKDDTNELIQCRYELSKRDLVEEMNKTKLILFTLTVTAMMYLTSTRA